MAIYLDMASECIERGLEAYRVPGCDSWLCPAIMTSGVINRSGRKYYQRSVVYNRRFHKKTPTATKPEVHFDSDDYSWRVCREVVIRKGDFIIVGGDWSYMFEVRGHEHDDRDPYHRFVDILRVKDIVPDPDGMGAEADVVLESAMQYSGKLERGVNEVLSKVIVPQDLLDEYKREEELQEYLDWKEREGGD